MARIAREYKQIQAALAHEGGSVVSLEPTGDDLSRWAGVVRGPGGTPYEGHLFSLTLVLDERYPSTPPVVTFAKHSMPHCNVDYASGAVCLDILTRERWSPAWDLLHVLEAIVQLLSDPEPDSPLDVDLANILRAHDRSAYYGLVQYYLAAQQSSG